MWRAAFPLFPMASLVRVALLAVVAGSAGCTGCEKPGTGGGPGAAAAVAPSASASPSALPAFKGAPAPARLVAIGDLHGDLAATRKVLMLAGAIDAKDAWIGGKLVVVQTGDAIDRGDDDRAILDLLERLKVDAAKAGGALVAMSGNHEIMNASFDFRYVTEPAFGTFGDVKPKNPGVAAALEHVDAPARGRAAAFAPGGPYANMIAARPVVYRAGDTVFVHGGVLPKHVAYGLDRINDETRAWLLGDRSEPPRILVQEDGPIWSRMYSAAPGREECAILNETLTKLGAKRMVMGHTVQRAGISPACEAKGWRIDVGLSRFYGGPTQALAIEGDVVTVLKE
jgi:hypothetical protein